MLGGVDGRDVEHLAELIEPLDVVTGVQNSTVGLEMLGLIQYVKVAVELV